MFSKIEYTKWQNTAQEDFKLLLDWNNSRVAKTKYILLEEL